jgi:hypothetical protein
VWFPILTNLGSFLLGFITSVFADPVRQRLYRPVLRLSFSGGEDSITRTRMSNGGQAIYVRMKVVNEKPALARQCCAYLIGVENMASNGCFHPTPYVDSIQLAWSCQLPGNERSPLDLPNGVSQYVDVVSTNNTTSNPIIQIAPFPFRDEQLFTAQPKRISLRFKYPGMGLNQSCSGLFLFGRDNGTQLKLLNIKGRTDGNR